MSELFKKHIELVEAVNGASSDTERVLTESRLRGFRDALELVGINHLMDCDLYYINQGIDRPMCCGVFLD